MNLDENELTEDLAFGFGDSAQHARMRILAIDDQLMNIELLQGLLEVAGYKNVKTLSDSRLAIDTCHSFDPDIILLDLMMPHVSGLDILRTLRSSEQGLFLPVIVLTADANEKTRVNALRAGATDFLLKPFDEIEVLLRISNLLEMRRLHIQLDTQRAAFEEALRERSLELREAQVQQPVKA
jgi:putative two-component system response regulator